MRQPIILGLCLSSTVFLAACQNRDAQIERAMEDVNVIDETNLNEVMLTIGDPEEAVAYFRNALAQKPDRIDLKRGLARSLVRAGKAAEAVGVWAEVAASPDGTRDDHVSHADALIRDNKWAEAEAALNRVPPTHETFDRYRLEAMVADSKKDWARADSFYEIAAGLTTRPAGVLNNWGFSKLSRGEFVDAQRLFVEALTYDPGLFAAKNNLVMARAAQRNYDLPIVKMTQIERAKLLYTAGLAAIKQGDNAIGKGLLDQAVKTHPQHFEAAARSLAVLDANVTN